MTSRANVTTQLLAAVGLLFIGMVIRPWVWPVVPTVAVDRGNNGSEEKPGQTEEGEGLKPKPSEPVAARRGEEIEFEPLAPQSAPARVENLDLVRQTLKPGQTHETLLKGSIETEGTDRFWGIESVVSIYYLFEAEIDRDIIDNDGSVVVEHRHFQNVRSLKIDTTLKDLKLQLGDAKTPIITGLTFIWPAAALAVSQFDGVSTRPVLAVLTAVGVDPLKYTSTRQSITKMFTQFDSLTGKSVKQVYWNKDGRTGVIRVTALQGDITKEESFFHHNSAVLSDVLLFPERTKAVGESWTVQGNAFSNLVDPGLRAAVGGEVEMMRGADQTGGDGPTTTLRVVSGRLTLQSDEATANRIGWFEPQGELLFSPEDEVITEAHLSGRGLLERVSRNHLLFRTEMKQEPKVKITYSCRVRPTSGEK